MTSWQVSEKPKIGPLTSQIRTEANARPKSHGLPLACETLVATEANHDCTLTHTSTARATAYESSLVWVSARRRMVWKSPSKSVRCAGEKYAR